MIKKLQLFLMPSFEAVRESMGFDEFDEDNTEAILFQQGYNGSIIDILDGQIFKIKEGFIGRINSKGNYYLLSDEEDLEDKKDYQIENEILCGKYRFSAKERVLYVLGDEDDELFNSEDNLEEPIYDLITMSAKSRFDYASFSANVGDESADNLLFQIIVSLAIGESKKLTVVKLQAQIMLMGFMMEKDSFINFIEEREKDLALEILALKMAQTNLDLGANPQAVYLQTEKFLSKSRK